MDKTQIINRLHERLERIRKGEYPRSNFSWSEKHDKIDAEQNAIRDAKYALRKLELTKNESTK